MQFQMYMIIYFLQHMINKIIDFYIIYIYKLYTYIHIYKDSYKDSIMNPISHFKPTSHKSTAYHSNPNFNPQRPNPNFKPKLFNGNNNCNNMHYGNGNNNMHYGNGNNNMHYGNGNNNMHHGNTIVTSKDVNSNIKTAILDYLYNKIEVNDHKYVIIKNISDVYQLKNIKHYMAANTCGINSLLIFIKKDDNYYSYLIDRRSISYNRQSLNISKVRFTEIKLPVSIKIYDGTILDGILIDSLNSKMEFMITDAFMLNGKSLITMDYKMKMYMMEEVVKNFSHEDKNCNNINYNELNNINYNELNNINYNELSNINVYVSRPFEINQFNSLFNEYISTNVVKYNIKGITFYPNVSGTKLIYIFDKSDEKLKNDLCTVVNRVDINKVDINRVDINRVDINKVDINRVDINKVDINKVDINKVDINNGNIIDINNGDVYNKNSNLKIVYKYELVNIEDDKLIECNLEMHKTDIPDVFKLFGIFLSSGIYIKKRIGIAYIPSYKLSLKCKSHFMNKNIIIFTCKLDVNKNKWIPVDEANIQKIDIINKHPRFTIIEEEVYDTEDTFGDDDACA